MRVRTFLRTKNVLLLLAVVMLVPFIWSLLLGGSDLATLELYQRKLVDLTDQLHYSEAVNKACQDDIVSLRSQINLLTASGNMSMNFAASNSSVHVNQSVITNLWKEANTRLRNVSGQEDSVFLATMFTYLPHLLDSPNGLFPNYKLSRRRTGVSIVIGIPTIKRPRENYLTRTIESLIGSMSEAERAMCLIIVMIAEPYEYSYVLNISESLSKSFSSAIESGLLEIISTPPEFYPDFSKLKSTFGDTIERVKWRTKQNLDYAFLMLYASTKGQFYVQIEDDVVTKQGFVSVMKAFTQNQKGGDWVLLEFCTLGFIGKLFKTADLPRIVEFFLMFYREKPVDWLMDHYLYVKVCSPEKDQKVCRKNILEIRKRYKPSLFQHIGTYSSLSGKVQKLKDRAFGKQPKFRSHINPVAMTTTSLSIYQRFSLDRCYLGENFFWATNPKKSDYFQFVFSPTILIASYEIKSGDADHPMDLIRNAQLQIQFVKVPEEFQHRVTQDSFLPIDAFENGQCSGEVDEKYGQIQAMRVVFLNDSDHWALVTEIKIKQLR